MNDNGNSAEALHLQQLICQLDSAISLAIQNPQQFIDHPLLQAIESKCVDLMAHGTEAKKASYSKLVTQELVDLAWQVRTRSGRLQNLLDAAARFYSTCFALQPNGLSTLETADDLAYGVHGEWGALTTSRHLVMDC